MEFSSNQVKDDDEPQTVVPATMFALVMAATLLEYSLLMF